MGAQPNLPLTHSHYIELCYKYEIYFPLPNTCGSEQRQKRKQKQKQKLPHTFMDFYAMLVVDSTGREREREGEHVHPVGHLDA